MLRKKNLHIIRNTCIIKKSVFEYKEKIHKEVIKGIRKLDILGYIIAHLSSPCTSLELRKEEVMKAALF